MERPRRKPNRLQGYDYGQTGTYFVTICTKDKQCLFGHVVGEGLCALPQIQLSDIGQKVQAAIAYMARHCQVDAWIIMPNHVHLLIGIVNETGGHGSPPLQKIIGGFKSYTTHQYGAVLWQRSYYDHIVRNKAEYIKIYEYITGNPLKWHEDCFYCE